MPRDALHFPTKEACTAYTDDITYAWLGSIVKVEKDADGNVLVYGKVTDGTIDSDDQIVDPDFAKKALAEWYDTGANVRQMHATTLPPAGKGIMLESRPDGEYVQTKVVEPVAQKLCENEVYTGYSVGISRPRIVRDVRARGGRITGGKIVEVSLVDRPANPMAKFAVLKAEAGHLEYIGKVVTLSKADDPNVGGGVDRGDIAKKDFVLPEDAPDGGFPIHSPGDVEDAVSSWGRYRGNRSFEAFKRRLTSIARRKGPEYEQRLPQAWKESSKAAGLADEVVRVLKAAGITHEHEHPGPNGPHTHVHTHAPNHGDHSASHAHTHTEEFVTDEQQSAAPEVAKAEEPMKCSKCKGVGKIRKGAMDCPLCGGTGIRPAEKQVAPPPPIGFPEESKAADAKPNPFAKDSKDAPAAAAPAAAPAASAPTAPAAATSDDSGVPASGDTNDAGDEPDEDDKPPVPLGKRKAGFVESTEEGFKLYGKGGKVIGTHSTIEAAVAQKAEWDRERSIRKQQRSAEKRAKAAAEQTIRELHPKVVKQKKAPVRPWLIRRAHDFACPVYDTHDVYAVYPSAEKSEGGALGPTTRVAINAELERAVRKYNGSGKRAVRIEALSKALEALDALKDGDVYAAREEYHDAFKSANPMFGATGGTALPKPGDPFQPGRFNRPYIDAGHQREIPSASAASIPSTDHPVRAEQFTRGPLADGHQRYLVSKLADFHDAITAVMPDLCRASDMNEDGSFAEGRQPPGAFVRAMPTDTMDNRDSAAPKPKSVPETEHVPGQTKVDAFVFDGTPGPGVKTFSEDELRFALTKTLEPYIAKIDSLERTVESLGSQPDPARSAHRGVTSGSAVKVATVDSGKASQKAERQSKKAARREYIESLTRSSDPTIRIHAVEKLAKLG